MKKQNVLYYFLSAINSVFIVVILFLEWNKTVRILAALFSVIFAILLNIVHDKFRK